MLRHKAKSVANYDTVKKKLVNKWESRVNKAACVVSRAQQSTAGPGSPTERRNCLSKQPKPFDPNRHHHHRHLLWSLLQKSISLSYKVTQRGPSQYSWLHTILYTSIKTSCTMPAASIFPGMGRKKLVKASKPVCRTSYFTASQTCSRPTSPLAIKPSSQYIGLAIVASISSRIVSTDWKNAIC